MFDEVCSFTQTHHVVNLRTYAPLLFKKELLFIHILLIYHVSK